ANRFTVCPLWPLGYLPASRPRGLERPALSREGPGARNPLPSMELAVGLAPTTACLQNRCSTVELRQRGPKPPRAILGTGLAAVKRNTGARALRSFLNSWRKDIDSGVQECRRM